MTDAPNPAGPAPAAPAPPRARVCVLTPDGRGAVAVLRVWGPGAVEAVDAAFRPAAGDRLAATEPNRLRVGRIGAGTGDEVVAVIIPGDPPEVEVHCHGGPAPAALVLDALSTAGAEPAPASAWARHAAGGDTPSAQATLDLARAPTARAAEILLEQAAGALEADVSRVAELLPVAPTLARAGLNALLARARVGTRLVGGWRVALAGRPNVGKSRLLNALAGYERAIVAPVPGTTRDVVTARTALAGWPVELADTAGVRPTDDPLESAGVALARSRHAGSDLVVLVLDRSEPITAADRDLLSALPDAVRVANKVDLPPAWDPAELGALPVSAELGTGLDALIAAVARRLVPEAPPPGAGVPFRPEHASALEDACRHLDAGDPDAAAAALEPLCGPRGEPET